MLAPSRNLVSPFRQALVSWYQAAAQAPRRRVENSRKKLYILEFELPFLGFKRYALVGKGQ
jgi:hypothetical protein